MFVAIHFTVVQQWTFCLTTILKIRKHSEGSCVLLANNIVYWAQLSTNKTKIPQSQRQQQCCGERSGCAPALWLIGGLSVDIPKEEFRYVFWRFGWVEPSVWSFFSSSPLLSSSSPFRWEAVIRHSRIQSHRCAVDCPSGESGGACDGDPEQRPVLPHSQVYLSVGGICHSNEAATFSWTLLPSWACLLSWDA